MTPITVEIRGTGVHNRGAELMAIAISERMRASFPGVRLVVSQFFGPAEDRKRYGFLTDVNFNGPLGVRLAGRVLRALGGRVQSALHLIDPEEIDVVLDASGFAFSDQWGPGPARGLLERMNAKDRSGKPLVLLPQALGPFSEPDVAEEARALFDRAELVCARDDRSHAEAARLMDPKKLRQYPDFTLGVRSIRPTDVELPSSFTGIVPNLRMLDKTEEGEDYLSFLGVLIGRLRSLGMNPIFVLHDSMEDWKIVEMMELDEPLRVLQHPDPRFLKGILGAADLVVGSRFHGLVSSLSQGVPCIGVGWSHKYPELFKDFGVPELVIADLADHERLDEILEVMRSAEGRADYRRRILTAGAVLKEQTEEMWQAVEAVIRTRVPAASP